MTVVTNKELVPHDEPQFPPMDTELQPCILSVPQVFPNATLKAIPSLNVSAINNPFPTNCHHTRARPTYLLCMLTSTRLQMNLPPPLAIDDRVSHLAMSP